MLPNKRSSVLSKSKSLITQEKKRHTIKALLIVCFFSGLILSVRCARGTTHDFKILKQSRLEINPNALIKTDKGFIGITELFPNSEVPHKSSKYHPLSKEQRQYNQQLAKDRTVIEHRNRECKI